MASREVEQLPSLLVGAVLVLCALPLLLGADRMELHLLFNTQQNASHLHALLEYSAFYTALATFILGLIHFILTRNSMVLIIGAALACAGVTDAIHMLMASGLLGVAGDRPDLLPYTWTVSRYFTALLLALSACIVLINLYPVGYRTKYVLLLNTVAIGGLLLGFAHLRMVQPEAPTKWAMIMAPPNDSVAIIVLLLFSLLLFVRLNAADPNPLLHAMVISIMPQLGAQLYMLFGSKTAFDAYFYSAHVLNVVAYLVPFVGLALYHVRRYQQTLQTLAPLQEANSTLVARQTDLEAQHAELNAFNYIAGHDLQEPVRKLIAFCHHLRRNMGTNLPRRAAQDLHYIVDAATRMQVLIQTLLAFSKSEQAAVKPTWVSVDDCVDDVLSLLALRLKETQATIHRDPLPAIQCDRHILALIYQNLIENALKFVTNQPPVVRLTAEPTPTGWVLGVQDQGIGIKPEQARAIFAPFTRLHGEADYAGMGIGLAICRKAVERHRGRIWVDTQMGQGAHFKFTLGNTADPNDVSLIYHDAAPAVK